ncbi:MAG: type II toxin-antitoxin system Phd/YefM family antitoxin [Aliihoeflea sp.]|uniref:type II toxin-antitoxin system Phd/YefM family antitoxin n=1 Tax=Aliihoeflea sp. TaxID=2608088 RepID=UPI0040332184
MKSWPVQDAKARFSDLLATTVKEGPQMVTRRGVDMAVMVPIDEWKRLTGSAPRTLKELLLADAPRFDFEIPRIPFNRREPPRFED